MTTILDVAKLSGYSKSTVSRVINGKGPVSKQAENEIKKAMQKLDYTPNYFARGMRTNRTNNIAVLIPDYTNPFYPELIKSIEKVARKNDYVVTVCDTDEKADKELQYIREIVKRNIDGIIFCTYNRVRKNINYLIQISKKIPVIFMDRVIDDKKEISYVITDGYKGTCNAATYLIEKGRKKIGYIKGSSENRVTKERYEGYKEALNIHNIKFDSELIYTGNFTMESGFKGARELLNSDKKLDAIMAATDVMAIGAIKYLKYSGLQVPDDINVVGFDNISLSSLIEPGLTTIAQPIQKLGKKSTEILIKQMQGEKSENNQIILEGDLIKRGSTEKNKNTFNILDKEEEKIVY
ncbi:MAG: LacI family DNA-binding transcriptional regulator [Halanaerobiales bacterium]